MIIDVTGTIPFPEEFAKGNENERNLHYVHGIYGTYSWYCNCRHSN